jgi:hypothetical protein
MLYVVLTMPTLNKAYLFIYLFIYNTGQKKKDKQLSTKTLHIKLNIE